MLMLAVVDTTRPLVFFFYLTSGVARGDFGPPCDIQVLLFPPALTETAIVVGDASHRLGWLACVRVSLLWERHRTPAAISEGRAGVGTAT